MLNLVNQSSKSMPRKMIQGLDLFLRKKLRLGTKELTIVFLDPGPAKKLNQEYRQRNYATDVLSFLSEIPGDLGDLVICPQVVERQAKEHGLTFREELAYMIIHGVLHLMGYDHEKSKSEAQKMFRIQDELFDQYLR